MIVAQARVEAAAAKVEVEAVKAEILGATAKTGEARDRVRGAWDALVAVEGEAVRKERDMRRCVERARERVGVVVERMREFGVVDGDVEMVGEEDG